MDAHYGRRLRNERQMHAAVFCRAAIFDAPLFSAVFRAAYAPLHVKIMFSTSLYCPCADHLANAPFLKSRRQLAIQRLSRGKNATAPTDGRHPAATRRERKMPAAAKGDLVPRAARSADARASLASTPAARRADTAGCTADGYSRAARQQAHGEGKRHAALPCGEPPSEAATQTVLRTVCAHARAFSDGTERWCGCRAKSHRGGILRATDAAQRRLSVMGIARTVCHNHTILWRK